MPQYITPDEVQGLDFGGSAETDYVERWCDKAERRLRSALRRRGVDLDVLAADPDHTDDVRDVLENAVLRVLRNPDGASSESEGDYSVTVNPLDASGNIWFPAADLDLLAPARATVGTIKLASPVRRTGCW